MTEETPSAAQAEAARKPTVAGVHSLAQEALEQANLANQVNAELAAKINDALEQAKTAAQLVNALNERKGDLVKPDDGTVRARLERLEAASRGQLIDYQPMIDALTERVNQLAPAVVTAEQKRMAHQVNELREQVAALAELAHTPAGQDTVGSDAHQALTEWTENQVNALGVQLNELAVNLSRRLEVLEETTRGIGQTVTTAAFSGRQPQGVHAKMLLLMDEVTAIGKDRRASGGGVSFKFRGVEDAQNAVGQAQRKVRILILPEVVSWEYSQEQVQTERDGKVKLVTWSTSRLTMRYTFVDPDDGSSTSVTMVGEGKDNSDKSASKAASMACKYALFQGLMIPFEDVEESDAHNDAVAERDRPRSADFGAGVQTARGPVDYPHATPGARVNSGEISPAQAVDEYTRQAAKPKELTREEKAAKLLQWVRGAQAQGPEVALGILQRALEMTAAAEIGDVEVEGVPLRAHLASELQNANAAIQAKAKGGGAQGVTRAEQQAGAATRAVSSRHPVANPTAADFEDALMVLDDGAAPDDALRAAQQTVNNFEESTAGVQ